MALQKDNQNTLPDELVRYPVPIQFDSIQAEKMEKSK